MTEPPHPEEPFPAIDRSKMLRLVVVFEGSLLVLALLLGYLLDVRFWMNRLGDGWDLMYGTLLSLPVTGAVIVLVENRATPLQRIRKDLGRIVGLLQVCTPLDLLLIAVCAGLCEEALFRGVVQPYLTGVGGVVFGIAVTSLIFGGLHAMSFSYFVFAAAISVYLGIVYVAFGGLAAPVALHGAYDFAALLYGIYFGRLLDRQED